jgi:hypothetical protein
MNSDTTMRNETFAGLVEAGADGLGATGNCAPGSAAGNRSAGTGVGAVALSLDPSATIEPATSNSQQPTSNIQHPTANSQQPTSNIEPGNLVNGFRSDREQWWRELSNAWEGLAAEQPGISRRRTGV